MRRDVFTHGLSIDRYTALPYLRQMWQGAFMVRPNSVYADRHTT